MFTWWRNLSVSKKLYSVVGLMAVLIATELFTLLFAMSTLSSVRAFVAGEGLWTKAQKNAFQSLYQYALSGDEKYYAEFQDYLEIPNGDHIARLELMKPKMNREAVREGFLEGKNHPGDVDGMIDLLVRFHNISYIRDAIVAWTLADSFMDKLRIEAEGLRHTIRSSGIGSPGVKASLQKVAAINSELTKYEIEFSSALGAGSRWLEHLLMTILVITVFSVESTGLFLTFRFSRNLGRSLKELISSANAVGKGDFSLLAPVHSRDELGQMAKALNKMTLELKDKIKEKALAENALRQANQGLESHVKERTAELAEALVARDEFLAIASHELKTPLTSLKLRLQLSQRNLEELDPKKLSSALDVCLAQTNLLNDFIEDLLDISKIRAGQLTLDFEQANLSDLTRDALNRLSVQLSAAKISPELKLQEGLIGHWDKKRVDQVITNLISNAIKYAPGRPLQIFGWKLADKIVLTVEDSGPGIAREKLGKIFDRFERATRSTKIGGLGLGLYIARRIMEAHNGSISVTSETGRGTKFRVELPAT